MKYRRKSDGLIVMEGELRALFPNTSFPSVLTPQIITDLGFDPVFQTPSPSVPDDLYTQVTGVEQDSKGNWVDKWEIFPKSMEQIEAERKAKVPHSVTMRQARLALHSKGKLAEVETKIDTLAEPMKSQAKITWEYSQVVEREQPFVKLLSGMLGLTEPQTDELFTEAAKL